MHNRAALERDRVERSSETRALPSLLQIDVTGRCNMRCPFCYLAADAKPALRHMSPRLIPLLHPALAAAETVTLYGTGEPLASPHFDDFFLAAAATGARTYFTTNGTLLSPRVCDLLVNRLTYLSVSFSAGDAETFARVHGHDYFDRIVRNVEHLIREKEASGTSHPRLRLSFVAARNTLGNLPGVIRLAERLRCSEGVAVSYLVAYDEKELANIAPNAPEEFREAHAAAGALADSLGVPLAFKAAAPGVEAVPTCQRPWEAAFVRYDGDVFICTESAQHPLGSITTTDFQDIWNGEAAVGFRTAFLSEPYLCCRYCNQCQNKTSVERYAHLGGELWVREVTRLESGCASGGGA